MCNEEPKLTIRQAIANKIDELDSEDFRCGGHLLGIIVIVAILCITVYQILELALIDM